MLSTMASPATVPAASANTSLTTCIVSSVANVRIRSM
jgi:hypothetical protein